MVVVNPVMHPAFCSVMVANENAAIARAEAITITRLRRCRVGCGAPQRVQMWAVGRPPDSGGQRYVDMVRNDLSEPMVPGLRSAVHKKAASQAAPEAHLASQVTMQTNAT
jgi:hypothetical protein